MSTHENEKKAYTLREAAALLGVHYDTVRAMIVRGELPVVEYARQKWIPKWAIDEMFDRDQLGKVKSKKNQTK